MLRKEVETRVNRAMLVIMAAAMLWLAGCSQNDRITYRLCEDGNNNGRCGDFSDKPIEGVPAIIIYTNGTTKPTTTNSAGEINYSLDDGESGLSLDIQYLQETWNICVITYFDYPNGSMDIATLKRCDSTDA